VCVTRCNFHNCSDFAVAIRNGTSCSMTGCSIVGCNGAGIVIEGGHRTSAEVSGCSFSECGAAVRIGTGLVDVQLLSILVEKCSLGVYTMIDTIGSVVMTDCTVKDTPTDRLDVSGRKCHTNIDGVLLPHSTQRQRNALFQLKVLGLAMNNNALNIHWSMVGKRQFQSIGLMPIVCAKCGEKEPEHTKHRVCGKCKRVFYCSKACQTEHWHASHRAYCKYTIYRAKCMLNRGYIGCSLCHKAELMHRTDKTRFSGCSYCMQVVYCSEECQSRHWNVHKANCKNLFRK